MMSKIVAPIAFFFLGFSLHISEGLHCWECNSRYDPNCGDPFKNHTISLADCNQRFLRDEMNISASICRKITQKVQSEVRIIRSCGFYNPEDAGKCISRAGTHLVFMHYCQCAGEGCNGATSLLEHTSLRTFIYLLILAYVFS